MKIVGFIALCLVCLISPLRAQYEFSLTGYAMDIPSVQAMRTPVSQMFRVDQELYVNVARLRLRPTISLWTGAQLSAEYEISSLSHSTAMVFGNQSDQNRRQVAGLQWTPVQNDHFTLMHFVDRLHFRQTTGIWDIAVGRQRIAWGTGRIWNPTDLFNPINPTSFAKIEKDGVDAGLVKMHLGDFTDISVVVNPQRGWKRNNAGVRFRTNYGEFDFSVMGGRFDERTVVGADFAGNLMNAGIRGEGIFSARSGEPDSSFVKMILGIDFQFTSKLYALLEFHFNGEGAMMRSQYDLRSLAAGEILNVGRNYIALQASILVHPLVNMAVSFNRNLDDHSQFCALAGSYSASDEVTVALGGQLFLGEDFSEYWWYPNSLYLKAELFF